MVVDGASTHKIDYVTIFEEILNLEGHLNRITGLRVNAILLNVWLLPIGGASAVEGLVSTGLTPSSLMVNTGDFLALETFTRQREIT